MLATVASVLVAHLFRLPEAYWAAVSTLIVMQSTLGAALPVSAQRFVGTAVGAAAGAVIGTIFPGNLAACGVVVFAIGVLATAFSVERSAFRYANITVAIVMLVPRPEALWSVAIHRFFEVSIGIGIALVISAVWPEEEISNPAAC